MDEQLRVLIVEDEPMLAFQLEDEVTDAGHQVVGCAMSGAEALEMASETHPDLVLMDVLLADGATGVRTAQDLSAGRAVVVFVTASARDLPQDFGGAVGVIDKPWSTNGMKSALRFLARALVDGVPPPPPGALRLSPSCKLNDNGLYCWA